MTYSYASTPGYYFARSRNSATFAKPVVIIWLAMSGLIQTVLDLDPVHLLCVFLATTSSIAAMAYILDIARFRAHPLSMVAMLGYNVSAISGALLVQTVSLRPITYNLQVPAVTFSALAGIQMLLLGVHWAYARSKTLTAVRTALTSRVFTPLKLLDPPTNGQLWIMGLVGCSAMWITDVSFYQQVEYGDVSLKLIDGFKPLVIAPLMIPLGPYVFGERTRRTNLVGLAAYFPLLVFIAMGNNVRSTFGSGMLAVAVSFIVCLLSARINIRPRQIIWTVMLIVISLPLFSMLSDLSRAMVIVRSERSLLTPMEAVSLTISTFLDVRSIEREPETASSALNDEVYIENPFFKKLIRTRYIDIGLSEVSNLTPIQVDQARAMFTDRLLLVLPTPILSVVAPSVDKDNLKFSSGDFYWSMLSGEAPDGYRTGSSIADGWAIMGIFYVPLLAILAVLNFIFFDGLTICERNKWVSISAAAMISIWAIFQIGILNECVAYQLQLFRGFPETLLIYWFVFMVSRAVLMILRWPFPRRLEQRGRS
jgi:hypothetical protein